jgi:Domain of unknown function (DUF4157)/DNA/RNA non-specific endonuclease
MVAPPSVEQTLNSPGRPLDLTLRRAMERRFGHDFSRVRVHSGTVAAQSAREVKAHAYTVGQDIVFGAGQYAPDTLPGRKLLAHELTHVVQQEGGLAAGNGVARLQRLSFSDVLEVGATVAVGPVAGQLVRSQKQFIDDLVASVKESPQHVGEFLKDEVWESIKDHWLQIIAVTVGLIFAEMVVGVLTALPEPTLLTKVIAAILQIAIIAIIGYFAAVEVKGAYEQGGQWLSAAKSANGDPKMITEASKSFVRMVWHIIMAILTIAGVRARIRGFTIPKGGGVAPGGAAGAAGAGEGGSVTPISSHPKFQPRTTAAASGEPSASAFGPGSTARKLDPIQQPVTEPAPLPETPAAAPATAKTPAAKTGPGVQVAPAVAAGLSAATAAKPKQQKDACKDLLNLSPGINDFWHRQRPAIGGEITVSSAAFRLDRGIDPPPGQDTTVDSRLWVRKIGLPQDDAGHVIANRFGGKADFNSTEGNIFPQDLSFNRGTMRSYDAVVAGLHQRGCDVCTHIGLEYNSPTDLRPSAAVYTIMFRSPGASLFNPALPPGRCPNP